MLKHLEQHRHRGADCWARGVVSTWQSDLGPTLHKVLSVLKEHARLSPKSSIQRLCTCKPSCYNMDIS